MAREPTASPTERATAARLLADLPEEEGLRIVARESWEVALLQTIAERWELVVHTSESGVHEIEGSEVALDAVLSDLIALHGPLEAVVVSATAGFLAAHFPSEEGEAGDVDPVLEAAFRAAHVAAGPRRLAAEDPVRQIPGPVAPRAEGRRPG